MIDVELIQQCGYESRLCRNCSVNVSPASVLEMLIPLQQSDRRCAFVHGEI